jgi:ubiquinone biosynthesis monooxygenase Coq7
MDPRDPLAYLRVDHAGEAGAIQIYRAQALLARWRAPEVVPLLREFRAHEEGHLARFAQELAQRSLRPCRTLRLCQVGGYALGLFSATLGRAGMAACTEAVETVVLAHLRHQIDRFLAVGDLAALACIEAVIVEEEAHRQADLNGGARPWSYRLVHALATHATRGVIALGLREPRSRRPA